MKSYFPDLDEAAQSQMVTDFLNRSLVKAKNPSCLLSALQILEVEGDDGATFAKMKDDLEDVLREDLIIGRTGRSREAAAHFTPKSIKNLKPEIDGEHSKINTVLVWQASSKAFEGYYPKPSATTPVTSAKGNRKDIHSTSRTYGGKWTQFQALSKVIDSMWLWHKKYGKDSFLGMVYFVGYTVSTCVSVCRERCCDDCVAHCLCCFVATSPRVRTYQ